MTPRAMIRMWVGVLAVGLMLALTAASAVAGTTAVLREHVRATGVYEIQIAVGSPTSGRERIELSVGSHARRALVLRHATRAGTLSTRVQMKVALYHRSFVIRVIGYTGHSRIRVQLRRVSKLSTGATKIKPSVPATVTPTSTSAATQPLDAPLTAPVAATPVYQPGPPGDPSTWRSVFDDEFSGSSLDTTKWSTGWGGGSGITAPVSSSEEECEDPAQVTEGSGELDLAMIAKPESCGGQTRPYASGMITTANGFHYTYGYMEARVWVPGNPGGLISAWPEIWADGESWPTDGELDVLEGIWGQACWHFHNADGSFPVSGLNPCSSTIYTGGWHTFGADWEPSGVTWYYDGVPMWTLPASETTITAQPMYLILDLSYDPSLSSVPLQTPATTMRIDYVRVWQHSS